MKKVWLVAALLAIGAGTWYVLVAYTNVLGGNGFSRAMSDIKDIEKALDAYKAKNGKWPDDLESLTTGPSPLLSKAALTDPWKRPYQFDPSDLHPKTKVPRVWSEGEPSKADGKIANW